jgi:hypothetical protein
MVGSYIGSQIGSNVGSTVGAQIGSGNARGGGKDKEAHPKATSNSPFWDEIWHSNSDKPRARPEPSSTGSGGWKPQPQPESPRARPEPSSTGSGGWKPQPQKPAPTNGASNTPSWIPHSTSSPYSTNEGKLSVLSVSTKQDQVYCRKYPDSITPDISKIETITGTGTRVDAKCWILSELESVPGVWLRTVAGCFIHETNIKEQLNFHSTLNECGPAPHWVGTLQTHYQRKDCYTCTSLNCQSQNLGHLPYADLQCSTQGETVQGNRYATFRNSYFYFV